MEILLLLLFVLWFISGYSVYVFFRKMDFIDPSWFNLIQCLIGGLLLFIIVLFSFLLVGLGFLIISFSTTLSLQCDKHSKLRKAEAIILRKEIK